MTDLRDQVEECISITKYVNASKESTWRKFTLVEPQIRIRGFKPHDASFLAMKVLNYTLNRIWQKGCVMDGLFQKNVPETDHDTIAYIAGNVLHKAVRKSVGPSKIILFMLTCEADDISASHVTLTSLKDRGGLTYVTNSAFEMFTRLESNFRVVCEGQEIEAKFLNLSLENCQDDFLGLIQGHDDYTETLTNEIIMEVFKDIMKRFFKVRIHHRCKMTVQSSKKSSVNKKFGLRKSLLPKD